MPVAPARAASVPSATRRRPRLVAAAASCTAGLALYCTRASLDVYPAPRGPARIAMLPSWPELVGLIVLTTLVTGAAVAWLSRRRARPHGGSVERLLNLWADRSTSDVLWPLFALALLVVPYLPWVADAMPILRVLAGPARFLLWFVVLAQVAFAARAQLRDRAAGRPLWIAPPQAATVLVFVASVAAFGAGASRLAGSAVYPGGDEPHYLIVTQSLLRDGDLQIENNHQREDYAEYFGSALEPHYRTRGVDRQIYSIHPVGLSFLAVPAYALGGYTGVVALLVLIAALAATLMWRRAAALTRSMEAATFAWAAVALGAPFFFNAFAVYPEIPAALAVMLAVPWSLRIHHKENAAGVVFLEQEHTAATSLGRGLAVAALPWLSTKYAPMAAALTAILVWRVRKRPATLAATLAPIVIGTLAWFWFFYWIWGSPLPSAPYGPDPQTTPATLRSGAPGLLIDQEYGVFVFAPALMLVVAGWSGMWRAGGHARQIALESVVAFAALLGTVGAFELWWGGSGIAGRPLVSGIPLMAPATAWTYHQARTSVLRRSAHHFLLLAGLAITGTLLFAQGGLLLAEGRDGASELLRWLSPDWPITAVVPSFIADPPLLACARAVPWIAAIVAVAVICRRVRVQGSGRASLAITLVAAGAALAIGTALAAAAPQRVRSDPPGARGRIDLLDGFDAVARPYAITYDPPARIDVHAVPPLFTMVATPGSRRHPQPLDVLLNARFSLPAGEYEVELLPVEGRALAGELGLQVGRLGRPLAEWPVTAPAAEPWRRPFTLHVDAAFVGFMASGDLASTVGELRLHPRSIVDKGSRVPVPTILAASGFGDTAVYFHDDQVWAEDTGFWVAGRTAMGATVAMPEAERPLTLKMHGGPRPSTVFVETPVWRREVPLTPGQDAEVVVPPAARGRLIPLRITTYNGFVPARESPGTGDQRLLGCWVEIRHR